MSSTTVGVDTVPTRRKDTREKMANIEKHNKRRKNRIEKKGTMKDRLKEISTTIPQRLLFEKELVKRKLNEPGMMKAFIYLNFE